MALFVTPTRASMPEPRNWSPRDLRRAGALRQSRRCLIFFAKDALP